MAFALILILSVFWTTYPTIVRVMIIGLIVLSLPALLVAFKDSKLDKAIGSYSYPIYITHYFCIFLVQFILHGSSDIHRYLSVQETLIVLCLSVTVSYVFLKVERKFYD